MLRINKNGRPRFIRKRAAAAAAAACVYARVSANVSRNRVWVYPIPKLFTKIRVMSAVFPWPPRYCDNSIKCQQISACIVYVSSVSDSIPECRRFDFTVY